MYFIRASNEMITKIICLFFLFLLTHRRNFLILWYARIVSTNSTKVVLYSSKSFFSKTVTLNWFKAEFK